MTVLNFPTRQSANPTKTMEDAELIEACIDGDQRALAEFVERFRRYIRAIVGRTVRRYRSDVHATVMEDLSQEVFMALLEDDCRRLRMFEGRNGCPARAWVRLITIRTTISKMRRWRNHVPMPTEDSTRNNLNFVDNGPTAIDVISARDDRKRTAKLLKLTESLGEEDRVLLEMIYVREMPVPAITESLNIRRGALYMRKNRALSRLRASAKAAGLLDAAAV